MNKSFEKLLALIASFLGIIAYFLDYFDRIPRIIKANSLFKGFIILMLLLGAFFLIRYLIHNQLKFAKKVWSYFVCSAVVCFFLVMILSVLLQKENLEEAKASTATILGPSVNEVQKAPEAENKIEAESINNSHIVNGNNNVIGVNGDVTYELKSPPPLTLTDKDLKKVQAAIPALSIRVRVINPANSKEASAFSNHLFDTLLALGYSNVTRGTYNQSMGYYKNDRITIREEKSPYPAINLIINPQQ